MKRHVKVLLAAAVVCSVATAEPLAVAQLCTKAASVLQQCSTELPALEQQNTCCAAVRVMQDLGCFCLESTKTSSRSAVSPAVWQALPVCKLGEDFNLDSRCSTGPTVESTVVTIPGISEGLSTLGPEFVQAAAAQQQLAVDLFSGDSAQLLSAANAVAINLASDKRPVLDLSTIPEDVTLITDIDNADMTVTVTEDHDSRGDMSMTLDIDLPQKMLATGVEFSLDFTDPVLVHAWNGMTFTLDVDLPADQDSEITVEIDTDSPSTMALSLSSASSSAIADFYQTLEVSTDMELEGIEFGAQVSDDELMRQLSDVERFTKDITLEVDFEVPQKLSSAFASSDITIEMEIDLDDSSRDSSIIVTNDIVDLPMSGRALGALLLEAAEWMSAFLPMPLTDETGEAQYDRIDRPDQMIELLGGALHLLAEVGDKIGDTIPDEPLQAGDTLEVRFEESTSSLEHFDADGVVVVASEPASAQETLASLASRRSLDALTAAVNSAMFASRAETGVLGEEGCSICEWVHEHLRLLWCIVYANVALLAGCIVIAAVRQYSMRSEAVPTIPDSALCQPLILDAADFAEPLSSDKKAGLLAPVWEPSLRL